MITIKEYNERDEFYDVNMATSFYVKFVPTFGLNSFEDIFDGRNYIRPIDYEFTNYTDGFTEYQKKLENMLVNKYKDNDIYFDLSADERGLEGWIFADEQGVITENLLNKIILDIEDFGIVVDVIVRYENGEKIKDTMDIFYLYDIIEERK